MSDTRTKLTRDSDLYQDTIRTKTINNMENNSKIINIIDSYCSYTYNCKIKHPVWESVIKSKNNISKSKIIEIDNMNPVKRARVFGKKDTCPDDDEWKAFGDISITVNIKLCVQLADGEEITLIVSEKLRTYNDLKRLGHLYNITNSDKNINTTVKEDEYILETTDYTYTSSKDTGSNNFQTIKGSNGEELLLFASNKQRWVKATIGDLFEEDNTIILPIRYSSNSGETTEVTFKFENPETNEELWGLVEELDVGDPMMLSGEELYISNRIIKDNGITNDELWYINAENNTTISDIWYDIKSFILP